MKTDKMCRGLCSAPSSGFEQGGGGVRVPRPLPEGSQSSRLPLKGGFMYTCVSMGWRWQ